MTPRVLCIGELVVDLCAAERDLPLASVGSFLRAPGGAPANVAVGTARLGCSSAIIGSVGADFFGVFLLSELARYGVDATHVVSTQTARTTLAFIADHTDGRKDVEFFRHPGADMMLSATQVEEHYVSRFDIVHFGSVSLLDDGPRHATLLARDVARRVSALTSYDVTWRPTLWPASETARSMILSAAHGVSIVKMSDEEWAPVMGTDDFEQPARALLDAGVQLVVRTEGVAGARVATARHRLHLPAFHVSCIDSLGAGDAFMAGLIAEVVRYRLDGAEIEDFAPGDLTRIIRFAHAVAALTIQARGAMPALPTAVQVDAFLAAYTPGNVSTFSS